MAIAAQIKQAGGEYVLTLKANQGKLNQQVNAWFGQAQANGFSGIEYSVSGDSVDGPPSAGNPSGLGGGRESITTVASPKSVVGVNHSRDGHSGRDSYGIKPRRKFAGISVVWRLLRRATTR